MTKIIKNFSKPAPPWFRKLTKAVSVASDTAIVFLLAAGYGENSLAMLIVRIGVSNALKVVEGFLVED